MGCLWTDSVIEIWNLEYRNIPALIVHVDECFVLKLFNFVSGWPVLAHDSRIFRLYASNCSVYVSKMMTLEELYLEIWDTRIDLPP